MQSKTVSKRKIFYAALSFLVAVSIWIFVDITGTPDGSPRTVTEFARDIPIEYIGEETPLADRGLMLLEEGTDATIDLELTGTRWAIACLDKSELRVRVYLTDIMETGEKSLNFQILFPSDKLSKAIKATQHSVSVNIGELDTKEIPIHCEIVGSVAEGYTAGELQMSRSTMEIRGQAEDIAPVAYAKVTLNLDNAEGTVQEDLTYEFYNANNQLLDGKGVHTTVGDTVQVTLPVTVVKELRLVVNFKESPGARKRNVNWKLQPETITVSGDAAVLKNMDSLELTDFDLATLGDTTTYVYPIKVPPGCENLSGVTQARLNISFEDMVREQRATTRFSYKNLQPGKACDVLTAEMTVSVFGTSEDVAALTGENIQVVADLSGYGAANGSYTVPAEILVDGGGDIGISGTYQVRVSISETPAPPPADPPDEEAAEPPAE